MKNKIGIIYKATSPSGKVYIGQTTIPLRSRMSKHYSKAINKKSNLYNTKFYQAIRKYGIHNFIWKILYSDIPKTQLNELEIKTIQEYNSFNIGYNATLGGDGSYGYIWTDEAKYKISAAHKGKIMEEETKNKISMSLTGNKNPFYGKRHTTETLIKIGQASKGRKHSEKSKKAMSEKRRGTLNPRAKINENIAQEIRNLYKTNEYSYTDIAKRYNISNVLVGLIVNKKIWKKQ